MSNVSVTQTSFRCLGAQPRRDGMTTFRVWAPAVESIAVAIGDTQYGLVATDDGVFEADVPACSGEDCEFVLNGHERRPDPCSRAQPSGLHGPSRVVDLAALTREEAGWTGVGLADLVIYGLHIGTFSPEGTFDGAIPGLAGLRELGVTAIEVMPIAPIAGDHGWGYDGVYAYAPHPAYGGPEGFARLIAAAHRAGLAVILDVVYNISALVLSDRCVCMRLAGISPIVMRRSGARRLTIRSQQYVSGRCKTPRCGCATTVSTVCGWTLCT